jgi:hypothetical protein
MTPNLLSLSLSLSLSRFLILKINIRFGVFQLPNLFGRFFVIE